MDSSAPYVPRDPRAGVLHPLVSEWWPKYVESVETEGGSVPGFVVRGVERYLNCGVPEAGFVHLRCSGCGIDRALAFSCKGRGLCPSCGARRMHDLAHHLVERVLPDVGLRQYVLSPPSEVVGLLAARGEVLSGLSRIFVAGIFDGIRSRIGDDNLHCGSVVLVQRFTKSLGVYPHFHVLVLDGGYVEDEEGVVAFMPDRPPTAEDLRHLEDRVMSRFSGWLGKHGYLGSEDGEPEDSDAWWRAGANEPSGLLSTTPGKVRRAPRFDVNAGVRVGEGDKVGREQLCRYVARPPLAEAQLQLLDEDRVRLEFRSPLRSGQSSIILHPLALMRRLAWLVPPPGQHQIRYGGVLAPAARLRALVVPVGRVSVQGALFGPRPFESLAPVAYRTSWAQLLARVYDVDGHACPECSGRLQAVGAVLVPAATQWILEQRIVPLLGTGPPGGQLWLPLAS